MNHSRPVRLVRNKAGEREEMRLESVVGPGHEGLLKRYRQFRFYSKSNSYITLSVLQENRHEGGKVVMDNPTEIHDQKSENTALFYRVSTSVQAY